MSRSRQVVGSDIPTVKAKSREPIARTPEAVVIEDFAPASRGLRRTAALAVETPLISILILTLDGRDLLDRLFVSFAAVNTYPNVEFVVVDHGSTDGTVQLLRQWAERLPMRFLARGTNFSFSQSNNKAARLAAGGLLLLLNNDLVFTTDCLGGMASALSDPSVGAVGLKQYQGLPDSVEPRRVYHLGVRFGWNIVERRLRPYHVRPSAMDAQVMQSLAAFPAVTASAMLCRREDYLSVGGLSEAYDYGLEDVDFCCKVRHRLGKEVVCFNRAFAFHPKNATRNRDPDRRRPLEKHNRRVLQARCGYAIRRDFITSRLDDDGSVTGRPFTAGFALAGPGAGIDKIQPKAALELGEALRRRFGWKVLYLGPDAWTDASDLDLYVSFTPLADVSRLASAEPHLVMAACLVGEADGWLEAQVLDRFDVRFCAQETTAARLDEVYGGAVRLVGDAEESARQMHDCLAGLLNASRISLKVGEEETPTAQALALRRALADRGHLIRIHPPAEWYGPASLADDVVLALTPGYRPASDQINLHLGPLEAEALSGRDAWDIVLLKEGRLTSRRGEVSVTRLSVRATLEDEVEAIEALIQRRHADRVLGPVDPPLEDPRRPDSQEAGSAMSSLQFSEQA